MKYPLNINNANILRFIKKVVYGLVLISMISCISEEINELEVVPELKESINFLALGDSYTIGQGVEESLRWPNQLKEKLADSDYNVDAVKIIAQTGWTTGNLIQAIENTEISNFNLVSLLIGVNNQYQNQSFSIFQDELNILLDKSIVFSGDSTRVFVVSIPDYGVTPFGSSNSEHIMEEIDMYNDYISSECDKRDIPFIDITEISRELGSANSALAGDNLHPSGLQYGEWVKEILPTVLGLLE